MNVIIPFFDKDRMISLKILAEPDTYLPILKPCKTAKFAFWSTLHSYNSLHVHYIIQSNIKDRFSIFFMVLSNHLMSTKCMQTPLKGLSKHVERCCMIYESASHGQWCIEASLDTIGQLGLSKSIIELIKRHLTNVLDISWWSLPDLNHNPSLSNPISQCWLVSECWCTM